jgi:tRNA A37 threonylcarbamoyltransferase TsaD
MGSCTDGQGEQSFSELKSNYTEQIKSLKTKQDAARQKIEDLPLR